MQIGFVAPKSFSDRSLQATSAAKILEDHMWLCLTLHPLLPQCAALKRHIFGHEGGLQ